MTDYTVDISGSTTMMIRDTGGWVEFWIRTGSQTWNNDQQYSFSANGSYSGVRKFRMLRGGQWQYIDQAWVEYDQDVDFTIYGAGLGFPTYTFNQHIQRSTVPQAPTLTRVFATNQDSFVAQARANYDGGSPISVFEYGYGFSSSGPTDSIQSDDEVYIDGFTSGQKVYFWVRVLNDVGWSEWSNRLDQTTWRIPPAPDGPTYYDITQTSVGVSYTFKNRPSDPSNLEKQIRYGRDITGTVIDGTITVNEEVEYLYNLDPGKTYYFWGRSRNPVGWGPWSSVSMLYLIAGARVLVSGTWRRAVPYVKVGGIWKMAEPWIKDAGIWKRTSI